MAEHPNAAVYERYVGRISRGDVDAVASLIAEDVVWREPGGAEATGGREALQAFIGFFTALDGE